MTPRLRWLRWIAPALILGQVARWAFGADDPGWLVGAIVVVESLLTILVLGRAVVLVRSAAKRAQPGDDWLDLVEAAFSGLFPDRIAQFASSEVRVLGTLVTWMVAKMRRTPAVGYAYNRHQMLVGWVMLFALSTPAEMLLLHILIPWDPLKWIVLIVEVYGLIWLAAIGVSFGFLRHTVSPRELRLRQGLLADVRVQRDTISDLRREVTRSLDGRTNIGVDDDVATIAMEGRTDLTLDLSEPIRIRRLFGFSPPVSPVRFAADDPDALLAAIAAPAGARVDGEVALVLA